MNSLISMRREKIRVDQNILIGPSIRFGLLQACARFLGALRVVWPMSLRAGSRYALRSTSTRRAYRARQASEAYLRSNRVMHAWLDRVDPVTGLLPRRGDDPNWVVKDSAADLYPFLVIAAYFTEPAQYEGAMRRILRRETLLTTRVGRLSDDLLPGGVSSSIGRGGRRYGP